MRRVAGFIWTRKAQNRENWKFRMEVSKNGFKMARKNEGKIIREAPHFNPLWYNFSWSALFTVFFSIIITLSTRVTWLTTGVLENKRISHRCLLRFIVYSWQLHLSLFVCLILIFDQDVTSINYIFLELGSHLFYKNENNMMQDRGLLEYLWMSTLVQSISIILRRETTKSYCRENNFTRLKVRGKQT